MEKRSSVILLSLLLLSGGSVVHGAPSSGSLNEGDLVFQSQGGDFSKAIKLATHSKYNHMGMVFIRGGKPYVLEAVGPVKFTSWDRWTKNGTGGHFVAKRSKDTKPLTPDALKKMEELSKKFLGKRYSFTFEWNDQSFYCSGLVWRIYHDATELEIGRFQELKELELSDPLVKKELKKYFGPFVPMGHKIISPEQMFESDLLTTIDQR